MTTTERTLPMKPSQRKTRPMSSEPKKNQPGAGRPTRDDEAATSELYFRCTPKRKAAYVIAAKPRKLSEWVFEHLDKAAGYDPTKEPAND